MNSVHPVQRQQHHNKQGRNKTKETRVPSVQTIFVAYADGLKQEFQPTLTGAKTIICALERAHAIVLRKRDNDMDEDTKHRVNAVYACTYVDICPKFEVDYDQKCGAAFLSLCCVSLSLKSLCRHNSTVLPMLILVAKELGVGDMLRRCCYSCENIRLSLFNIIRSHIPLLAILLLKEPRTSPMFPNLMQEYHPESGLELLPELIFTSLPWIREQEQLIQTIAVVMEEKFVEKISRQILSFRDRGGAGLFYSLLIKRVIDPGILFMSKTTFFAIVEKFGIDDHNIRSSALDLYVAHSNYANNILPLLLQVIGPSLLHISSLCELVKSYLFVYSV